MKKKHKKHIVSSFKHGVARQYLIDNFSLIPEGHLKKGHILFLYLENEKSAANTYNHILKWLTLISNFLGFQWYKHFENQNKN